MKKQETDSLLKMKPSAAFIDTMRDYFEHVKEERNQPGSVK